MKKRSPGICRDIPIWRLPPIVHRNARWRSGCAEVSASWAVDGLRITCGGSGKYNHANDPGDDRMPRWKLGFAYTDSHPVWQKEFLDAEEISNGIVFLSSKGSQRD